jgi:hypothetical protein
LVDKKLSTEASGKLCLRRGDHLSEIESTIGYRSTVADLREDRSSAAIVYFQMPQDTGSLKKKKKATTWS